MQMTVWPERTYLASVHGVNAGNGLTFTFEKGTFAWCFHLAFHCGLPFRQAIFVFTLSLRLFDTLGSVKRQMKTLVFLSKAKNLTQKTLRYAQGDSTYLLDRG